MGELKDWYDNWLKDLEEIRKTYWQPIETAPKEKGSEYLVWDGKDKWLVHYISVPDGMEPKHNGCGCCVGPVEPTHWMPLPEPPK